LQSGHIDSIKQDALVHPGFGVRFIF
jgi:hypothetical protein